MNLKSWSNMPKDRYLQIDSSIDLRIKGDIVVQPRSQKVSVEITS